MKKHLVVIGGGAAGFFCAVNAARLNSSLQVTILEKTGKLLSKVRISGGGRCNVTHALFDITEMSKRYPRGQNFLKKSFHNYFTIHTIEWFRERGVELKTESDGRMFPVSDNSETIIQCLLREAAKYNVDIRMNAEVKKISRENEIFSLLMTNGQHVKASFVCIACGGYPKLTMFQWLQETGHTINPPVPSLFTFNVPGHPIIALMGVSMEKVRVKIGGSALSEEGPMLITHWGFSGPVVLRLSAWGARELQSSNYHFNFHVNWVGRKESEVKETIRDSRNHHSKKLVVNHNFSGLPSRLWQFLIQQSGIADDMRFADLPSKNENLLIRQLTDSVFEVKGKTTFKEEFVTSGGIQLNEIDPQTMMSRKVPNLFFAGEVMDVDGITGGFNFQHAWTSGWVAANAIAKRET
ncbi:MAG: NAD(P)/FAD-dependent oxidoreductase [Flavisolibacter sp.]